MKVYNSYILTVASLLLVTAVILVASGQSSLEFYYILYILEALAVTELYAHLSVKARSRLSSVSVVLFLGFLFIVAQKVISVLV